MLQVMFKVSYDLVGVVCDVSFCFLEVLDEHAIFFVKFKCWHNFNL